MNRAENLKDFQASVHRIQGIPWVNTLAADDQGQTLYMNLSVVPNVSLDKLAQCSDPRVGLQMIILDGSNSACAWDIDSQAPQQGIYAADKLPQLLRKDFVQHANDSAWMANPAQPLTGYSPLISQDSQPLGLRSRFALERLSTLTQVGAADLQHMVMDDQVYQADQVMPDLLQFCTAGLGADAQKQRSGLRAFPECHGGAGTSAGRMACGIRSAGSATYPAWTRSRSPASGEGTTGSDAGLS